MKKIILLFAAVLAVVTMQAQSVNGTWRSDMQIENGPDGTYQTYIATFTFNEDGTYNQVMEVTFSSQPAQTMALEVASSVNIGGTYALEGDQLTLTPAADTYKAEVLSISVNGHVTDDALIRSQVEQMLNSDEAKTESTQPETYTVAAANDVQLSLTDKDGEMINCTRFSTIQQ